MIDKKVLLKTGNHFKAGVEPGIFDYKHLVTKCTDAFDQYGRAIFKVRKGIVPDEFNELYPILSEHTNLKKSNRPRATSFELSDKSRVFGYIKHQRNGDFVAETQFTRDEVQSYRQLLPLVSWVNKTYKSEFPIEYQRQKDVEVDPHFLMGDSVFSQGIINDTIRMSCHLDDKNHEDSMSNMICLGHDFDGGHLVLPEYEVAVEIKPKDYIGFRGQEVWHGNSVINGHGTRITIVFYLKKEVERKIYYDETRKMVEYRSNKART